jgi:hypothetical protein
MLGNSSGVGVSGPVRCCVWGSSPYISGGSGLFIGGDFIYVDGSSQPANYVACWFQNIWASLYSTGASPPNTPGTDGSVYGIAWDGTNLYIGGFFNYVYDNTGSPLSYPYMVAYLITSGGVLLYGDWLNTITSVDSPVVSLNYSLSGSQPGVYAGGYFTNAGGYTVNKTAYWNGANWFPLPYLPSIGPGAGVAAGPVYCVKYDPINTIVVNGGTISIALEAASNIYSQNVVYYDINNYSWKPMKEIVNPYGVKTGVSPSYTNGIIYAAIAYGTDIYIGGEFKNAGGIYANNIARYDSSTNTWYGLVDSVTKINGVNGIVRSLYVGSTSGDNGLYVGGDFTEAGGIVVNYVARWNGNWNALTDTSYGVQGTNGVVNALTSNGSELYVGGNFTIAGGQGINYIATWNGANWNALIDSFSAQGTNGPVYAIVWGSSLTYPIILGGAFTLAGYQTATNIAGWDGTNFTSLSNGSGEGTNGDVYALAVGGQYIPPTTQTIVYVGGNFSQVGGTSVNANYVAAWTPNTWYPLGNDKLNGGPVRTLNYPGTPGSPNNKLFIGGDFYLAGILDFYSSYSVTSAVNSLVVFEEDGSSIPTSFFNTLPISSSATFSGNYLYNTGTTGVKLLTGNAIVNSVYYIDTNKLLVAGLFETAYTSSSSSELNTHNVAIMNLNIGWNNLPSPIPELNAAVTSIKQVNSNIYVGGLFTDLFANNQKLNYLTYWDTTYYVWMSIVSGSSIGVNNVVYSLENGLSGADLFVGGNFTTGGSTTLNRIGLLNTTTYSWYQMIDALSVDIGVNNIVNDIYHVLADNTTYICGDFTQTQSGTTSIYRVAKINASNQIVQIKNNSGSHIGMNNSVNSNLYISPNIYFGGNFTNASPTADLPMADLSYFTTTTTTIPLTINTTTTGFLDTENGTTYSQIVIPTRYKLTTLIYNLSLGKWLETYRSSGVTH